MDDISLKKLTTEEKVTILEKELRLKNASTTFVVTITVALATFTEFSTTFIKKSSHLRAFYYNYWISPKSKD